MGLRKPFGYPYGRSRRRSGHLTENMPDHPVSRVVQELSNQAQGSAVEPSGMPAGGKRVSPLGLASCFITLPALAVYTAYFVVGLAWKARGGDMLSQELLYMAIIFYGGVFVNFVGVGLGVSALHQRGQGRVSPIVGLVLNAMMILGISLVPILSTLLTAKG